MSQRCKIKVAKCHSIVFWHFGVIEEKPQGGGGAESGIDRVKLRLHLCLSQFQLGTSPRATLGVSLKNIARGVGILLLKVARGSGIRQEPGFCGKFKLCLTPYKCVLRRQLVFLVFNKILRHPV